MSNNVTDRITPEGRKFMDTLKQISELEVKVGYQAGKAREDDGTDICDVAMWNELGTENIPSRPFMRNSVDGNMDKITSFMKGQAKEILHGGNAEQSLKKIGMFQKGLIQNEITNGSFAPNSPATIRKKGSRKPLIDTGRMRQSVNYVIQKKGSGED